MQTFFGFSEKMRYQASTSSSQSMVCEWPVGGELLPISSWIGSRLRLAVTGVIECTNCGQATKRSYSQGYCYPCFKRLARCDLCIMAPTRCHYDKGTCREPAWGESFCFAPHLVYLANSSELKVGITRPGQEFTRWTDQGAEQGLVILNTTTRQLAGAVEATLAQWVSDRANWRKLISEPATPVDLAAQATALLARVETLPDGVTLASAEQVHELVYPVHEYAPAKSLKLKLGAPLEAELQGIRGQYLLFTQGALNIRNLTSMQVEVAVMQSQKVAADDKSQMELFK